MNATQQILAQVRDACEARAARREHEAETFRLAAEHLTEHLDGNGPWSDAEVLPLAEAVLTALSTELALDQWTALRDRIAAVGGQLA